VSMDEQSGKLADETTPSAEPGTEAAEVMSNPVAHQSEELRKRRSTRIMQAVPLTVTGVDALGRPFTERTSTLVINCHGCRYQSKHYVLKNMWVTLEVPHAEAAQPPRTVRGRVAWIQRPRTVRQLFQVALELEVPGNNWGIAFPPADWFVPAPASSIAPIPAPAYEPAPESSKTAEIHLPLTEPEPITATAQDNLRVFPAPISATDASLQLARHMSRLAADAKQQLQAAAHEIAAQAVAAERRISAEEWEQKLAGSREQLAQLVASTLQRIQEEGEARWRAAHNAAAEALQRELPGWIAPQLEQLTRELTQQISDRGTAERQEHTQHLSSVLETLRSASQQAEDAAARLHSQVQEAQEQIAKRTAESTSALEDVARHREVAASEHREGLTAAASELQQQVKSSLAEAQAAWQGLLDTELSAAETRLRSVVETAAQSAQEKALAGVGEHTEKLSAHLNEQASRQIAAAHDAVDASFAEGGRQIAALLNSLREEAEQQAASVRESLTTAIAGAEQQIAGLRDALHEDAARQSGAAREAWVNVAAEAERQAVAARESLTATIAEAEQHIASLRAALKDESEQQRTATSDAIRNGTNDALQQAAAAREALNAAVAAAEQHINSQRTSLHDNIAGQIAAARDTIGTATGQAEQLVVSLRHALSNQSQHLESLLAQAAESTARLEHFSTRADTTQRQALASFESQIDDVLSLHRNELHRASESLLGEINSRIHTTFEESCHLAVSRFDQEVEAIVQPHISKTQEAIHRLAGGRSLLDAALTLQQDRIRASADEAFAEALAKFRENLGGVEQLLQDAENAVTARSLADYETKIADLKHKSVDDLMKSAEWYEKKAQTQIQNFTEKTVEQAETQFREKAGAVSTVFASELDHSSRSFVSHTQHQMEEVVRDAFEHSRALFAEAAETTTAAFTDEIQRQARTELDGFTQETQRVLSDTQNLLGAARAALTQELTAEQETFLREFRSRMSGAIEVEVSQAQEKAQSTLNPLLESWRNTVETHRHQMQSAYQELSNHSAELHRNRLENVSNQWMLATVASLNQQSREAVASIAAIAEDKLRETCSQVFANVGESLRERLQQIASSFAAHASRFQQQVSQQASSPAQPGEPQPPLSRSTTAGSGSSSGS
jgi:hypothetical protein